MILQKASCISLPLSHNHYKMPEKFKITVNGEHTFDLTDADVAEFDIQSHSAGQHIIADHHTYRAKIDQANFYDRKYQVTVGGKQYTIDIDTELDALIEEMGLELAAASIENEVYAPMPGLILSIDVGEGDTVEGGEVLCVLEAMKMENALTSPSSGTIKRIAIKQGQTVEKNELLVELDIE